MIRVEQVRVREIEAGDLLTIGGSLVVRIEFSEPFDDRWWWSLEGHLDNSATFGDEGKINLTLPSADIVNVIREVK